MEYGPRHRDPPAASGRLQPIERGHADQVLTAAAAVLAPDLTDPSDLAEEVIRLEGYDERPGPDAAAPSAGRGLTDAPAAAPARRPRRWPGPATSRC